MATKTEFIERLAEYLVEDQVHQSIRLEMHDKDAQAWAKLRGETPLSGYPTVKEATEVLTRFLA